MKAFIGHSFAEKDHLLVRSVADFIESADIACVNAERTASEPVSQKVKYLIQKCEIFVGLFARSEQIAPNDAWVSLRPRQINRRYTTSAWVVQESGSGNAVTVSDARYSAARSLGGRSRIAATNSSLVIRNTIHQKVVFYARFSY